MIDSYVCLLLSKNLITREYQEIRITMIDSRWPNEGG